MFLERYRNVISTALQSNLRHVRNLNRCYGNVSAMFEKSLLDNVYTKTRFPVRQNATLSITLKKKKKFSEHTENVEVV